MNGFITLGTSTYQMVEVTEAEMDKLISNGGDSQEWPLRYDRRRRVWPRPPAKSEVFFYGD
jgi:hypothetical protein